MNTGIITSFIIGGLLMISIVALNERVTMDSNQTAINQIVKNRIDNVSQVIDNDFREMGYGVNGTIITYASPEEVSFQEDLNNDGIIHNVTWLYDVSQGVSQTVNPNDHPLYRIVDGVKHMVSASVTSFSLSYIMKNGDQTASPGNFNEVRKIKVNMVCESPEPYNNIYQGAAWQKTFVPANLQF